jgi:hypothetical protein
MTNAIVTEIAVSVDGARSGDRAVPSRITRKSRTTYTDHEPTACDSPRTGVALIFVRALSKLIHRRLALLLGEIRSTKDLVVFG